MIQKKIKIQEIKDRINAVESLQEAGQDDDAIMLLKKLAGDILDGLND
jgi:hypothetical protein